MPGKIDEPAVLVRRVDIGRRAARNVFEIACGIEGRPVIVFYGIEPFLGIGGGRVGLVTRTEIDPEIAAIVPGNGRYGINRPDAA